MSSTAAVGDGHDEIGQPITKNKQKNKKGLSGKGEQIRVYMYVFNRVS